MIRWCWERGNEPESAESVVDGGDDDVVVGGQHQGVVDFQRRRPAHVTAAVDPDQHRRSSSSSSFPTASLLQIKCYTMFKSPFIVRNNYYNKLLSIWWYKSGVGPRAARAYRPQVGFLARGPHFKKKKKKN